VFAADRLSQLQLFTTFSIHSVIHEALQATDKLLATMLLLLLFAITEIEVREEVNLSF